MRYRTTVFAATCFAALPAVAAGTVEVRVTDRVVERQRFGGSADERPVYLAGRLTVTNAGPDPVRWNWSAVTLEAGTVSLPIGPRTEAPTGLIRVGPRRLRTSAVPAAGPAAVPPGGAGEFDVAFFGVPVTDGLPEMTLLLPTDDGKTLGTEVIGGGTRGLTFATRRIGPGGKATVLEVDGRVDVFSAPALTAEVARLVTAGAERVAVLPAADACDPTARRWLLGTARSFAGSPLAFDLFPSVPAGLKGFEVAVPGSGEEATPAAAVARLLAPALRDIDAATAAAVLADSTDPLTKVAVLEAAGDRLPNPGMLVALIGDSSPDIARSAIRAASHHADAGVIGALVAVASSGGPFAKDATAALASSRHRAAWEALIALYDEADASARDRILAVAAASPRPIWRDLVASVAGGGAAGDRAAALRAVAATGHPRLLAMLADAVRAGGRPGDAAFELLAERLDDPAFRRLAVGAASTRIAAGRFDDVILEVVTETADPELLEALRGTLGRIAPSRRGEALRLLVSVGGADAAAAVEEAWEGLPLTERRVVIAALAEAGVTTAEGPLADALGSGDSILLSHAVKILTLRGDADAVSELENVLRTASRPTAATQAATALASIGTPAAVEALEAAQSDPDETVARAAGRAWRRGTFRSAAAEAILAAEQAARAEDWEEAIRHWDEVIGIDAVSSRAFASRGHAKIRLGRAAEAAADYRRAYELEPTNASAITGVAIAAAGDPAGVDEAVAFVEAHADRLRYDPIFLYNTACVYGVAISTLSDGAVFDRGDDDRSAREPRPDRRRALSARLAAMKEAALDRLRRSVELGFAQFEWALVDPDLATLHGDPAFEAIMRRLPDGRPIE